MTPNQNKTPIALFVYNRPDHANAVLESLARCHRLAECDLHIYCDGSRRESDEAGVARAREVAREWAARLNGKVIERDQNLGLSRSIVAGVSELCEAYGRVIVVEDDFIVSPSFLDYMIRALDRYADEQQVYQVSGYMFPVAHAAKPDAFFLPLMTTWGWATWARAWKIFDWDAGDAAARLSETDTRRRFDLDGSYPYASMLEARLRNENDSWGILFWWAVFKAGGLALHPRESLVWVGGFDRSGTHCGDQTWSNEAPVESITGGGQTKSFDLPDRVVPDEAAFDRIKLFLRQETSGRSVFQRVRNKLANLRLSGPAVEGVTGKS